MDRPGAAFVKTACDVFELCSADYCVVAEQKPFVADLVFHRDQLHFCHQFARRLTLGHETSRPCGSVFHQCAEIRFSGCVGIADCVGDAGVRNAADGVNF